MLLWLTKKQRPFRAQEVSRLKKINMLMLLFIFCASIVSCNPNTDINNNKNNGTELHSEKSPKIVSDEEKEKFDIEGKKTSGLPARERNIEDMVLKFLREKYLGEMYLLNSIENESRTIMITQSKTDSVIEAAHSFSELQKIGQLRNTIFVSLVRNIYSDIAENDPEIQLNDADAEAIRVIIFRESNSLTYPVDESIKKYGIYSWNPLFMRYKEEKSKNLKH